MRTQLANRFVLDCLLASCVLAVQNVRFLQIQILQIPAGQCPGKCVHIVRIDDDPGPRRGDVEEDVALGRQPAAVLVEEGLELRAGEGRTTLTTICAKSPCEYMIKS